MVFTLFTLPMKLMLQPQQTRHLPSPCFSLWLWGLSLPGIPTVLQVSTRDREVYWEKHFQAWRTPRANNKTPSGPKTKPQVKTKQFRMDDSCMAFLSTWSGPKNKKREPNIKLQMLKQWQTGILFPCKKEMWRNYTAVVTEAAVESANSEKTGMEIRDWWFMLIYLYLVWVLSILYFETSCQHHFWFYPFPASFIQHFFPTVSSLLLQIMMTRNPKMQVKPQATFRNSHVCKSELHELKRKC